MKLRKANLGPNIILFGDSGCIGCLVQIKLLSKYYKSINRPLVVKHFNLKKLKAPQIIVNDGVVQKPTWYIPTNGSSGIIHVGPLKPEQFYEYESKKKNVNFGLSTFKFKKGTSWSQETTKKWGNELDSGVVGRECGPGKTNCIYSEKYSKAPGGLKPNDDLAAKIYSNVGCEKKNSPLKFGNIKEGAVLSVNKKGKVTVS